MKHIQYPSPDLKTDNKMDNMSANYCWTFKTAILVVVLKSFSLALLANFSSLHVVAKKSLFQLLFTSLQSEGYWTHTDETDIS